MDYAIKFDTTKFINESINEVVKTLLEAVFLSHSGRLFVFTELAGDADSGHCHSGLFDRHFWGDERPWVLN